MKIKIFLIVIILAFLGAIIWTVPIFKDRYSKDGENSSVDSGQIEKSMTEKFTEEELKIDELEGDEIDEEAEKDLEEEKESSGDDTLEKETYLDITKKDCDDKCRGYDDQDDLKYCQEVCGLNLPKENVDEEECEEEEGLEQDYCLRDLAISKKDFKICDKIEDQKITENCKKRITEDIIDSQ